jgi:hypothetical protein
MHSLNISLFYSVALTSPNYISLFAALPHGRAVFVDKLQGLNYVDNRRLEFS